MFFYLDYSFYLSHFIDHYTQRVKDARNDAERKYCQQQLNDFLNPYKTN